MTRSRAGKGTYITRMDYKGVCGYMVRVPTDDGLAGNLFSDSQYGGKEKALAKAERQRDELKKKLATFAGVRRYYHQSASKRSQTDVSGVYPVYKTSSNGGLLKYYVASYYEKTYSPKRQQFSVQQHGEEEALRRACEFRRTGEVKILKEANKK